MDRIRKLDEHRMAWALLGIAMAISATWLMIAGKDMTFSGDDIFYYARLVTKNGVTEQMGGLEYFLAPHNSHLQLLPKLMYRGIFLTIGADYTVFRAIEVGAVFLSVLLFFILARRRVRPYAALIPCVLLLFFGYGEQTFLWAFSIHTVGALVFGLAALLALERGDRRGDALACALLVLAVCTVELGVAFTIGVGVSVLLRRDRWRRIWIVAVPLAIWGAWWLWSQKFGQSEVDLVHVYLIPYDFTGLLTATVGSMFGVNPTGPGVTPFVTELTPWGAILGAVGVFGLGYRIKRGSVPTGLWIVLAALLAYWLMITLADRPPDSTRYLFVSAMAILLIAAAGLHGSRLTTPMLIGAACVVAFAIPPNISKFYDSRASSVVDAENTQAEYAMLELARPHVHSDYFPVADERVSTAGGGVFVPLSADTYYQAADEFGAIGYPLSRIPELDLTRRQIADATLAGALELTLQPASAPADPTACPSSRDGSPGNSVFFYIERGGVLLGSLAKQPVEVTLGRFGTGGPGVALGKLAPGEWADLKIPSDEAPEHWWITVDGPVYACPPSR